MGFLTKTLLGIGLLSSMAQQVPDLKPGDMAPDFETVDSNDTKIKLSNYKGKVVVLEWTNPQCPFVKKHYASNNMQKMQETYTQKGVIWLSIISSAPGKEGHTNKKEVQAMRENNGIKHSLIILDESGDIGHKFDARTTPHVYVIDKEGKIAYMGAIDDKPSTNKDDIPLAKNYLAAALDTVLEGKKVDLPQTIPYGCSVKYLS
jgi:peroxiredoxin